jgi:Fic/DOC family
MTKKHKGSDLLPPFLYSTSSQNERNWMKKLKKEGKIKSLGPRFYTSLPKQGIEKIVRSSWSEIVSHLYPNSVLSHRSALEFRPTLDGKIYLTSTTNRVIEYPGLSLNFVRGPQALSDDIPNFGFHSSSPARALLENFSTTKATSLRALSLKEIEMWLENLLLAKGEGSLNQIRDRARLIAGECGWQREFKKLDLTIGAMLGTRSSKNLKSSVSQSRRAGIPFDLQCNEKLELLFSDLRATPLVEIRESFRVTDHFRNKAFFESYFSNYIEGTTFEIKEAEEIIFDKKIPEKRPKDAHDILGTYQTVSDPNLMKQCPTSFENFESILKNRHYALTKERPETLPGEYKVKPNRAGDTLFVHPDYVRGTLSKGFEKYQVLPAGIARAIFMMFLVAEVHPFMDGNGRVSRILMNAELYSQGLSTIIIPNVYREDYLGSLRALTRRSRTDTYIRMLLRAQKFSAIEFSPYKKVLTELENRNWFREPNEAKLVE